MSEITVALDSLKILDTANPHPYHDQVLLWVRVAINDQPVAAAKGELGFHGNGALIPLQTLTPVLGSWPFVFDTNDHDPSATVKIDVLVQNTRGLDTKDLERLILYLTIATVGAAAGVGIPKDIDKALLAVIEAGKGLLGAAVSKAVEKLFEDPPQCTGVMGDFSYQWPLATMLNTPYIWETTPLNFTSKTELGTWRNSETDFPRVLGSGCGSPQVSLFYSFTTKRTTDNALQEYTYSYRPVKSAPLEAWIGTWSESSSLPRLYVMIAKGSLAHADALRVSVQEQLGHYLGTTVTDFTVDNRTVETGFHLLYGSYVWGRRGLLAGLSSGGMKLDSLAVKAAGASAAQVLGSLAAAAGVAQVTATLSSDRMRSTGSYAAATHGHDQPVNVATELHPILTNQKVAPSLAAAAASEHFGGIGLASFMEETLTVFIPEHSITLGLYKYVLADEKGVPLSETYAVRYSRADTLAATKTDAMLVLRAQVAK